MKNSITILLFAFLAATGPLSQEVTVGDPTSEGAGESAKELFGGAWVLAGAETKIVSKQNITNWEILNNELVAVYSWKDVIEIIHTVSAGYKWQTPPKIMQPDEYMNLEAVFTNIEYSTTAKVPSGIRISIQRYGADFTSSETNNIEILKVNKDNKQNSNEVKKGFFHAPKFLFDNTRNCQLVVDCYVGKDHYVTKYTYKYQQ